MTVEHYHLRSMAFSVICSWLGLQNQRLLPSCEWSLTPVKQLLVSPSPPQIKHVTVGPLQISCPIVTVRLHKLYSWIHSSPAVHIATPYNTRPSQLKSTSPKIERVIYIAPTHTRVNYLLRTFSQYKKQFSGSPNTPVVGTVA